MEHSELQHGDWEFLAMTKTEMGYGLELHLDIMGLHPTKIKKNSGDAICHIYVMTIVWEYIMHVHKCSP